MLEELRVAAALGYLLLPCAISEGATVDGRVLRYDPMLPDCALREAIRCAYSHPTSNSYVSPAPVIVAEPGLQR